MRTARRFDGLPRRAALLALVALMLSPAACRSTRFPDDPAAHPLWEELQAAPYEYYFLVRTGVRSRVLGILPEAEMRRLLDQVRRQWTALDRWERADAILTHLRTHGLEPIAERVEATLEANAANAPPDGADERLEAGAVKVGLLEALERIDDRE